MEGCIPLLVIASLIHKVSGNFTDTPSIEAELSNYKCPAGYYGSKCQENCPVSCAECSENGTCVQCAELGLQLPSCSSKCDRNRYGQNCKHKCDGACLNGECESKTGFCSACREDGFILPACTVPCLQGTYGMHCKGRCPEPCKGSCDRFSGICTSCEFGEGPHCTVNCAGAQYEDVCKLHCPSRCVGWCNTTDRKCSLCTPGFKEPDCREYCDVGTFGSQCRFNCSSRCRQGRCNPITGECDGCIDGYVGKYCNGKCISGLYGAGCLQPCPETCSNRLCSAETGSCIGCPTGYIGSLCEKLCPTWKHGDNCSLACPTNCRWPCDPVTGECHECKAGYRGSTCSVTCGSGTFGLSCNRTCPPGCLGRKCHHITGVCNACDDFYHGPTCDKYEPLKVKPFEVVVYFVLSLLMPVILLGVAMACYKSCTAAEIKSITGGQKPTDSNSQVEVKRVRRSSISKSDIHIVTNSLKVDQRKIAKDMHAHSSNFKTVAKQVRDTPPVDRYGARGKPPYDTTLDLAELSSSSSEDYSSRIREKASIVIPHTSAFVENKSKAKQLSESQPQDSPFTNNVKTTVRGSAHVKNMNESEGYHVESTTNESKDNAKPLALTSSLPLDSLSAISIQSVGRKHPIDKPSISCDNIDSLRIHQKNIQPESFKIVEIVHDKVSKNKPKQKTSMTNYEISNRDTLLSKYSFGGSDHQAYPSVNTTNPENMAFDKYKFDTHTKFVHGTYSGAHLSVNAFSLTTQNIMKSCDCNEGSHKSNDGVNHSHTSTNTQNLLKELSEKQKPETSKTVQDVLQKYEDMQPFSHVEAWLKIHEPSTSPKQDLWYQSKSTSSLQSVKIPPSTHEEGLYQNISSTPKQAAVLNQTETSTQNILPPLHTAASLLLLSESDKSLDATDVYMNKSEPPDYLQHITDNKKNKKRDYHQIKHTTASDIGTINPPTPPDLKPENTKSQETFEDVATCTKYFGNQTAPANNTQRCAATTSNEEDKSSHHTSRYEQARHQSSDSNGSISSKRRQQSKSPGLVRCSTTRRQVDTEVRTDKKLAPLPTPPTQGRAILKPVRKLSHSSNTSNTDSNLHLASE